VASLEPDDTFIPALLGEDALGVVVRAHIHIEARINALLDTMVAHPSLLPHLRYEQRVRLACALGLDDRWFKQLKLLGDLRNRVDYVNGTNSSPVVFLEGLYVEPAARRNGVARALVGGVEDWALAERCSELASDSQLENVVAHAVHRALGFEEMERVVYFRRAVHGT
jgi:GNAT superfamily N-acetyltransferase